MLEMPSTSSLSSKKMQLSSSTLIPRNDSTSTISTSEIQRSQSLQSTQIITQLSIVLADITKTNLLTVENWKQLERSRNVALQQTQKKSKKLRRYSSCSSFSSVSSLIGCQSSTSASTIRKYSRRRRKSKDKNFIPKCRKENYQINPRRTLRRKTEIDTRCSYSLSQQRQTIVNKYISTRSRNNNTLCSLDNVNSTIIDDNTIDFSVKNELPPKNEDENLRISHRDDSKSQTSSVLFAMMTSPPTSPLKIDFTDSEKKNEFTQITENNLDNVDSNTSTSSQCQLQIDENSTEQLAGQERIILKLTKDRFAIVKSGKRRNKKNKRDKERKKKKRSRSAMSINNNENGESTEIEREITNENEIELSEDSINRNEPVENITTKEEPPKSLNIIKNINSYLQPKLRFHSKTQAIKLGLLERNQRIINERKGIPVKTERKPKKVTKPKKKYVKKAQGIGKRPVGRPRVNNKPIVSAAVENIDDEPYVEYEDGRKLPSLPIIDAASKNRDESDESDDSCSSALTEKNLLSIDVDEFNRIIAIGEQTNDENVSEHVAEVKFCMENLDDDDETKYDKFLVKYKNPLVNNLSTETMIPSAIPEFQNGCRPFGERKLDLRKRIPRLAKKPPVIVEDTILPKGSVKIEPMNTNIVEIKQTDGKKSDTIADKKRKNVFAPEVAKKRKLLHASEFNPPNENDLNSFGIRSTVPSRQSLLPTKKIFTAEELNEKLSHAFKEWAKIPEIFEMINTNSINDETIKPKNSIKNRLGGYGNNNDKNRTENKENSSEISPNATKTVEIPKEISKSPEKLPNKIKPIKLIEITLQDTNKNESTLKNPRQVHISCENTGNNTFERVWTGITSTVNRTVQKRLFDGGNTSKSADSKRNCRTRWKREYDDDSDSDSSSQLKKTTRYSSSYNKLEEKSLNSHTSSTISTKSITQRLTEWSNCGIQIEQLESQIDDDSNCHSPSSIKTVVNASESDMFSHDESLNEDINENITEKLDNKVDENVNLQNSSDNDHGDDDSSSSSSSSSCASSCSNSETNSLSATSDCAGTSKNQENNESIINNNLNAEEKEVEKASIALGDVCNEEEIIDNVIIDNNDVGEAEEENDDDDDDAISLCAPTMDDIVADDADLLNLREDESFHSTSSFLPYKRMKSANIGRFVSENVREFDALYDDANNNIAENTMERVGTRWEPLPTENTNKNIAFDVEQQFNFQQPIATTSQMPTRINTNFYNNELLNDMKFKFMGQCFSVLKRNTCANINCKFDHTVRNKLLCLHMETSREIKSTLIYAITEKFFHYLKLVYDNSIKKLNTVEIMEVFNKMLEQSFPHIIREFIQSTLKAFSLRSKKIQQFVNFISHNVKQSTSTADDIIPLIIIDSLVELIDPGMNWEIQRNLILKLAFPTVKIIEKVLDECTKYEKTTEHIRDIEINIIKRLDENILVKINCETIEKFNKLIDNLNNMEKTENLKSTDNYSKNYVEEREFLESTSIASPDTTTVNNNNNNNNSNVNVDNNGIKIENDICNERNGGKRAGMNLSKVPTDLRSRLGVKKIDTTLQWKLIQIDNISEPNSVYGNEMWLFHKDLDLLKESLVRKDYEAVARTLEIRKNSVQSDKEKGEISRNFYKILCETILETPEHLEKIIITTVQNGVSTSPDFLQMLLNVGIDILKKLIHIGAWIVAHRLLKVLLHYYGGINNVGYCCNKFTTASFILLCVEIYIANQRPLKAFHLIKQSNLMIKNRSEWKVSSKDEDETIRILVLDLLLKILCSEHVEHAFFMYTAILKDQNNNFKPLDLSKYTDNIVINLLICGSNESLIEMIDLMFKYYLIATPVTIRASIVGIFHLDQVLSRQLHKYASEINVYPKIQHSRKSMTLVVPVDIFWTEEEMFLIIDDFLRILREVWKERRGIKARDINLMLNFEFYPSSVQLYNDDVDGNNLNNATLIGNAKRAMKNVLERFDPVITFRYRTQDQRLCKFINYTVVNYLKAQSAGD